jgi:hypothetical protein
MSELQEGDVVKVKPETTFPGDITIDISDWQGRIQNLTEKDNGKTLITIALDSQTLEQLPEEFIASSERRGLSWDKIRLFADAVQCVQPRDTEKEVQETKQRIWKQYHWYGLGDQGERILKILNKVDLDDRRACLEQWERYLDDCLNYPVASWICDDIKLTPNKHGDDVSILEISFQGDLSGIIANVRSSDVYRPGRWLTPVRGHG